MAFCRQMLSNAANVNAPILNAFSLPRSVTSQRALQGLDSLLRTSTQILLACSEQQGQRDNQHQPADPHPTIIPTLHTHVISVHKSSPGRSHGRQKHAWLTSSDRLLPIDLFSRSSDGRSLALQQTCSSTAQDYDRTSLCTWSHRNNTSAQRAPPVLRREPFLSPGSQRALSRRGCCS